MVVRVVRPTFVVCAAALTSVMLCERFAFAEPLPKRGSASSADGVYGRFDGDLDLALGVGTELGSAGHAAPALHGTAHYYSIAGVYLEGRLRAGDQSARSLFGLGVDLRPLFVPRWAKGFETGPPLLDLTLDSLSLSLGAFWADQPPGAPALRPGFETGVGFGLPLFARAAGLWLETRGMLRYPDRSAREQAFFFGLSWHCFLLTPLTDRY